MVFIIVAVGIVLPFCLFQIKKFKPMFLYRLYLGFMWGLEAVVSIFHKNLKWMSGNTFLSIILMVFMPIVILAGYFFVITILEKKESNKE